MAQRSSFWKTGLGAGDSPTNWTEADFANRYRAELTDVTLQGIYKGKLNSYAVTLFGGNATPASIASGQANVYGYWAENDASTDIVVTSPVTSTRIDRIVLRANMKETSHPDGQLRKSVRIAKISGAEGGAAPALTQTSEYWEIPLAQLSITTGGVITLTDQRNYVPLHGTNSPVVDTATISKVPYVAKRQGGDASSWEAGGSSNYTISGTLKMQCGVHVPTSGPTLDGSSSGYVCSGTITFPDAFSAVPFVMVQCIDSVGETNWSKKLLIAGIPSGGGPTTTTCNYDVYRANLALTGPAAANLRVAWVAIGYA